MENKTLKGMKWGLKTHEGGEIGDENLNVEGEMFNFKLSFGYRL